MRRGRRLAAAAAAVAIVALAMGAPSASAQEESGKACVANASKPGWTLIGFDPRQVFPVPLYELPTRVITGWKVEVAPGTGPLAQQLVAFQSVGEVEDREIGESAVETLSAGSNEFATRIPFQGLHPHVGLRGPVETLYCAEQKEMLSGVVEGPVAPGETRHYKVEVGIGTPVTVTVEPDRDGDGYGDLTQDGCPQLAAVHGACPFIRLRRSVTAITRRAIVIEVSTGDPTQVRVSGQVGWTPRPRGRPGRGTGHEAETIVGLDGGSREVAGEPGVAFTIPLPKAVRRRLSRMTARERLKAELTLVATDVAGRQTTSSLTVRLPGRGAGRRRR
jgi:hypothetical protein